MRVCGARIHVIFEEMSTVYGVVSPFLILYPQLGGGCRIGGGLDALAVKRSLEKPLIGPSPNRLFQRVHISVILC